VSVRTAADWFKEGQADLELSRGADSAREYEADLSRAVRCFDAAIALDAGHLDAHRERGLALAILGRHEEALDSFVTYVHQRPDDADVQLAVAQSLEKLGQWQRALGVFDEVLRLRPGDVEARFGRAMALTQLQRDEAALAAWDVVLAQADGRDVNLHGRPLRVLTDDFRRRQAGEARATVLARLGGPTVFLPVFDWPSVRSARFLDALRTLPAAGEELRAHVEAAAADANAWKKAAEAWGAIGRHDDALRAWDEVVRLTPTDEHAWFGRAEAFARAGRLEDAVRDHRRALEVKPGFLASTARLKVLEKQDFVWVLMGEDALARSAFVLGEFPTRAAAEAALERKNAEVREQELSVRDRFWIVPRAR
jgi:tetratricopeptide (TPR) repeat protein